MNREDIIRMAIEAELNLYINDLTEKQYIEVIERFANLVASAEREECVQIADRLPRIFRETQQAHYRLSPEPFKPERLFDLAELRQAEKITQAIRARGQA